MDDYDDEEGEFWLSDHMPMINWNAVKVEQDSIKLYLDLLEDFKE